MDQFDEESTRLGFSAMAIAESSKEVGYGEETVQQSSTNNLPHSNSATSFRNTNSLISYSISNFFLSFGF